MRSFSGWRGRLRTAKPLQSSQEQWPSDFNGFLHGLRSHALASERGGASVVLSGGAPDLGYTDWFTQCYPTRPERHILVEKFREPPDQLPDGVEFVRGSLGDLSGIPDGSVDLVFAGQVTEHLWADDLAGFLVASHRTLRPGGRLIIDSPNRDVTLATGWHMPEHTLELTPSEARELLLLAGFDIEAVRGLWLCVDPVTEIPFSIQPSESPVLWPTGERVARAEGDPDHSFVWWATAVRRSRGCDEKAVHDRVREIFSIHRPTLFGRLIHPMHGRQVDHGGRPAVVNDGGEEEYILVGPFIAMPPGPHCAVFTFVFEGFLANRRMSRNAVVATVYIAWARTAVSWRRAPCGSATFPVEASSYVSPCLSSYYKRNSPAIQGAYHRAGAGRRAPRRRHRRRMASTTTNRATSRRRLPEDGPGQAAIPFSQGLGVRGHCHVVGQWVVATTDVGLVHVPLHVLALDDPRIAPSPTGRVEPSPEQGDGVSPAVVRLSRG